MSIDPPDALPPLPPPPPVFAPQPAPPYAPPREPVPGELTPGWHTAMIAAWAGIVLGFAAVWNSSVKVGLSAWWLGPRSAPRLILISLIPFVLPVAVVSAAIARMRYLPFLGIVASAATAAVAAGDLGRVPGIAAIEFALAAAGLAVSVAALSGMYRADRSPT